MCLQASSIPPVPVETARVALQALTPKHPYLRLREVFGTFVVDADFADLFAPCGQPALSPARLALVTLLQYVENLSDRQAADTVRAGLHWKYLLGLELTDPGFDASVLSEFRTRLVAGSAEARLFEALLTCFQTHGLLKTRGRQRTDATQVLAAIRALHRLETVGETFRHTLNVLAVAFPAWLREHADPAWVECYARPVELQRLPQGADARAAWACRCGTDGWALLDAVEAPGTPAGVRALPSVQLLRHVWRQQYVVEQAHLRFRNAAELPPSSDLINSPYDPEARYGQKRQTTWIGYKTHITEQCEPDLPLLITDVETTDAAEADTTALPRIQDNLAARGVLPGQQFVDAGYTAAQAFRQSRAQHGIELVGPVQADTSWQARAAAGFAAADFTVNWSAQTVTCPAGHVSTRWQEKEDGGQPVLTVHFSQRQCRACPSRSLCTRNTHYGRRLTLRVEADYRALQAARDRARTAEFAQTYAARAGIEGTVSQAVRRCDVRHCRYIGTVKTRLQHFLTAAALNFVRVAAWLNDVPRSHTRTAAFVRVLAPT